MVVYVAGAVNTSSFFLDLPGSPTASMGYTNALFLPNSPRELVWPLPGGGPEGG